jgi:hypothetical protein
MHDPCGTSAGICSAQWYMLTLFRASLTWAAIRRLAARSASSRDVDCVAASVSVFWVVRIFAAIGSSPSTSLVFPLPLPLPLPPLVLPLLLLPPKRPAKGLEEEGVELDELGELPPNRLPRLNGLDEELEELGVLLPNKPLKDPRRLDVLPELAELAELPDFDPPNHEDRLESDDDSDDKLAIELLNLAIASSTPGIMC